MARPFTSDRINTSNAHPRTIAPFAVRPINGRSEPRKHHSIQLGTHARRLPTRSRACCRCTLFMAPSNMSISTGFMRTAN